LKDTVAAALEKARKLWGVRAAVDYRPDVFDPLGRCMIGTIDGVGGISFFSIKSYGKTFAEAFRNEELSRARDRLRYCASRLKHTPARKCRRCGYRGPEGDESWAKKSGEAWVPDEEAKARAARMVEERKRLVAACAAKLVLK
jgi:hypothetical protein